MLSFQDVNKIYYSGCNPIPALQDICFDVGSGEFVSIVGKSGAGKTTLVKLLIGEEKPTFGKVVFNGVDVSKVKLSALQNIRRKIGVVHQDYKLLNTKTAHENLSYIMQVIGVSDASIERDIPQVLGVVGLEDRAYSFPAELSGGEKQRLAIARALIHRPDLIIADEPTGNLDIYNSYEIVEILKKVNEAGTTVILSTHSKDIVNSLKKRVITLDKGRIIADEPEGKFIL